LDLRVSLVTTESPESLETQETRESQVFLQKLTKVPLESPALMETLDLPVTREQPVNLEMTGTMEQPERPEPQVPREHPGTPEKWAHRVSKAIRALLETLVLLEMTEMMEMMAQRAKRESQGQRENLVRLSQDKMEIQETTARKVTRGLLVLQDLLDKMEPKETLVPQAG
jgi:hypothetical protein